MQTRLDARLLQVSDVARALPRFDAHHDLLRADGSERVDDDFALDGLDRVNDDGDGARVQLLEGLSVSGQMSAEVAPSLAMLDREPDLLSVDVDARQPAAEPGVRVVPADDHLWSV